MRLVTNRFVIKGPDYIIFYNYKITAMFGNAVVITG